MPTSPSTLPRFHAPGLSSKTVLDHFIEQTH